MYILYTSAFIYIYIPYIHVIEAIIFTSFMTQIILDIFEP